MPSFPDLDPAPRPPGRDEFPETRWSIVRAAGGASTAGAGEASDEQRAEAALARLAELTWRPAAAYLTALGHPPEQALDLTQGFFTWVLASGWVAKADPARGSFRGFLKRSLKHFALDELRRESAAKRGGGRRFVPLEADDDPGRLELAAPADSDPEVALDVAFRQSFLARGLERLERELRSGGSAGNWSVFAARYLEDESPDRASLAARFGISETDVKNRLARTRARLKTYLRESLIETVDNAADLETELAWLFEGRP